MKFRRVVASEHGGRVMVADEMIDRIEPGAIDHIWRNDEPVIVPNDGSVSDRIAFPDPNQTWVFCWSLDAGASGDSDNDGIVEMDQDGETKGFHTTDSVDVHMLLKGTLVLELHDGTEIELNAGDSVVVNGNRHRWHNRGTVPTRALCTVVGAARK